MLNVGPATTERGGDDAEIAVFVDRLAAAGTDRPTSLARRQIRKLIATGHAPPGLRRLMESLAGAASERPPLPRQPSEDPSSVVSAMQVNGLVMLEDFDTAAVAAAVAALLADGRRVVVTGSTLAELADVRHSLPADVLDRVVDRLPALTPRELRELRSLLAMSTPARRARAGQVLPEPAALPAPAEVARLCDRAGRGDSAVGPAAAMVPALLSELDDDRRAAVTSVARCVDRAVGSMPPRGIGDWAWSLLSDVIYGRHRPVFDQMIEDTAQAVYALDRDRPAPPVQVVVPLPAGSIEVLRRYREFLAAGGRPRPYFRPAPVQRDAVPLLRQVLVGGRPPESVDDVRRVIDHLELAERMTRVDLACTTMGMAAPRNEPEVHELADGLQRVAAAARSVGALRHDVLFIAADSPISVPDVETAEQVAQAILEYAEHGSTTEAARRLDELADELLGAAPVATTSPEHSRAVAALRARDVNGYVAAVDDLGAARREVHDENRQTELLGRLAEGAPQLAAAWAAPGGRAPAALGLACFTPIDAVLSAVPAADTADVVLVLGAARLGVERLLLAAAAPRLIAAVAPGEQPDGAPTLVSVLHRASALVIRGRVATPSGTVVSMAPGPGRRMSAPVGQAGA